MAVTECSPRCGVCAMCGSDIPLSKQRRHAQYCSARCRVAAHNQRHPNRAREWYARNADRIAAKGKELRRRALLGLICVVCGSPIVSAKKNGAKYCTKLCRSRSRSPEQKADYWMRYYARSAERLRANHRRRGAAKREARREPRACLQCKRVFKPRNCRARYCSRACIDKASSERNRVRENWLRRCRTAARRQRIPMRQCAWCARPFKPARRSTAEYCSQRCMAARWARDHPDSVHAVRMRRRARLRGVVVESISPRDVFERDGWR